MDKKRYRVLVDSTLDGVQVLDEDVDLIVQPDGSGAAVAYAVRGGTVTERVQNGLVRRVREGGEETWRGKVTGRGVMEIDA